MASFSENLIKWYWSHKRSLPWRDETDPYKIWLAETMLQQTQVETVISYYYRWIEEFPTVTSVAMASQDAVLKRWEGLGYYSRCRNFHRACQIVEIKYKGKIPDTWDKFRQLPGVGDYTAAAVLSFAFGKSFPVLDGNVNRVMSRLLAFSKPVEKGKKRFIEKLNEWIDINNPGDFNQAMMELGSLICRKNQPQCLSKESSRECPVTHFCEGYQSGDPGKFPVREKAKRRPHKNLVAGIIWDGEKFLVQKRKEAGLLGGLWEFPGWKIKNGESIKAALIREVEEKTGLKVVVKKKIGAVDHAYSHFSITLHAYHCELKNKPECVTSGTPIIWINPREISNYPFPKVNHKLFAILEEQGWKR